MEIENKVNRPYRSDLRSGHAEGTRRALLTAATRLFAELGYAATSIDEIARAAGVSRATVFTSVGGKPALLKAAYDVALVGDDQPVGLAQRPQSLRAKAEPDPHRYLEMYAAIVTEIQGRVALINEAVRGAAGVDAEARALWEKLQAERLVGAQHVVQDLRGKGRLREGLTARTAADIVWTLIEPGPYHQLVHQRGWTPARFRAWLAETLQAQLLGT
jgi:AcrR family transcriptional regulator